MHTWTFNLEGKPHRIEFWDSRISGKKKLSLDNNVIKTAKDIDNFYYIFKIETYNFSLIQKNDDKYEIKINNRNFTDLMAEERNGKLQREKEEYFKKKEKEKKKNNHKNEDDYYKRAMKYNGDNYFEGDEIYDIEEQRKRLEEFEKKKKEKEKLNNKKGNNNDDDDDYYNKSNNAKKKFVLDGDNYFIVKDYEVYQIELE